MQPKGKKSNVTTWQLQGSNRLFWLVSHSPSKGDIAFSSITCLRIVLTASQTAKGSYCSYGESDAIISMIIEIPAGHRGKVIVSADMRTGLMK